MQLKFDIPEIGEEFIIKSLANKWRGWKCTLKKMYFDPAKSVEEHLSKVPERVDEEQWKQLIIYWSSEEGKVLGYLLHIITSQYCLVIVI